MSGAVPQLHYTFLYDGTYKKKYLSAWALVNPINVKNETTETKNERNGGKRSPPWENEKLLEDTMLWTSPLGFYCVKVARKFACPDQHRELCQQRRKLIVRSTMLKRLNGRGRQKESPRSSKSWVDREAKNFTSQNNICQETLQW
jgi:hypothetical protein